jgi:hypothetical protein
MLTKYQLEQYKKDAPTMTDEQLQLMLCLIQTFLKLFGENEYINFHNNYLLGLYKKYYRAH